MEVTLGEAWDIAETLGLHFGTIALPLPRRERTRLAGQGRKKKRNRRISVQGRQHLQYY